jgi:phosphopantothenoylcysteine decarboxylase
MRGRTAVANVLLGVTGSVAALRTPSFVQHLRAEGHAVRVVATQAALYFFDPLALDPLPGNPPRRNPDILVLDADEWPGRAEGRRWERDEPVLHIELRRWADLLLIAPLDANTLAKLANGLADNCLTCVWRAWEWARPVVLAPAMNTLMWENPATRRHLRQIAEDAGAGFGLAGLGSDSLIERINAYCPTLRVVAPVSKKLACGDVGVGGIAPPEELLVAVRALLPSRRQP